jgi:hypothetical protein
MTVPILSGLATAPGAHDGPLSRYIELFAQRLREQQFSPESVRTQVLQVAHLSQWLDATKLKAEKLTATAIDAYCREQHEARRLNRLLLLLPSK